MGPSWDRNMRFVKPGGKNVKHVFIDRKLTYDLNKNEKFVFKLKFEK